MNITREELATLIENAVAAGVEQALKPAQPCNKSYLNVAESVNYLASLGFHTTANGIYTMVSRKQLRADKINGKLAFTPTELESLVGAKTKYNDSMQRAARILRRRVKY